MPLMHFQPPYNYAARILMPKDQLYQGMIHLNEFLTSVKWKLGKLQIKVNVKNIARDLIRMGDANRI